MPPKKASVGAPKKAAAAPAHVSYRAMITNAIQNLKERNGSSRQSVKKYVLANNKITAASTPAFDSQFNKAIKAGVEKGEFTQPKGPSGPVKLARKESVAKPAAKKTSSVKAPAKKTSTAKKAAEKPEKAEKPKTTTKKATTATKKTTATKANTAKPRKTSAPAVVDKPKVTGKTKSGRVTKTTAKPASEKTKKSTAKKA
ncbi:linker histone H1 and H5 family-domain-containing protein [Aspergillus candidus]|uniref:Histone H1 n=1 Tax=Aspergillus candidus TaxID=41067 RepID=A0A2I2FFB8_ASPCN|nr:linker histone H1 and H5 family-domain-containing protein [Aspergillus candidus]PLB39320.1 linker histone H1 and H5 family-domain-containing protein [Aspergillus candidus]